MSSLITLCEQCTPFGRIEQLTVGVLIGTCEICGAKCPPTPLAKYWRHEVERALAAEEEAMPDVGDLPAGPSVKFEF